jgi:STAM-binding protein
MPESQAPSRPEKLSHDPVQRTATPQDGTSFAPAAFLENGDPLRTVFLPPTLRTTFLRIAQKNTSANLETCAFLAGFLSRNAFFVSKLVVPSQTSTSDTCEMTNESELFDYVDSEDLMILGWIHTHPTQTCFMSSRDLHTHSGYQVMLAESVAIVCAPSKGDISHGGDWGVFRLTDPPGKKAILDCRQPGIFHPHDVSNVYTEALKPGHVIELSDMKFDVVDLRWEKQREWALFATL